jgi:hypothetical protein
MKRVVVEELLDSDAGTPAEVAGSLKDLRMFNSLFGGVRTMSSLLRRVAEKRGLKHISWVALPPTLGIPILPFVGTLWRFPSKTTALTLLVARCFCITLNRMRLSFSHGKVCAWHGTHF